MEGDERRRREQVRKRTGSLTRDNGNGTDPRLDMWENSEAERTGSSTATTTRRDSLPPASTTPPVVIAPTPTTAPEKEIERNAEAAGSRVGAKEKAMREENEAKKETAGTHSSCSYERRGAGEGRGDKRAAVPEPEGTKDGGAAAIRSLRPSPYLFCAGLFFAVAPTKVENASNATKLGWAEVGTWAMVAVQCLLHLLCIV